MYSFELLLILLVCILAAFAYKHFAIPLRIVDIPNARSMHTRPIVRGGGLVFVLSYIVCFVTFDELSIGGSVENSVFLIAVLILSLVSFVDDIRGLLPVIRLVVHFGCALSVVLVLRSLPELPIFRSSVGLPIVAAIAAIVWSINLFNFMDGIDLIAACQGVFVSGGAALILLYSGEYQFAFALSVIAVSVLAFGLFNIPPASMFMGDVGSVFLGFVISVLAIVTSATDNISPWSWLILYGVFVVDATTTLVMRVLSGQRFWKPHRTHLYQLLALRLGSHVRVVALYMFINVLWFLPLAVLATVRYDWSFTLVIVAYLPAVLAVVRYRRALSEEG